MPTTEKPLRLELSLPQSNLTVNALLEQVRRLPAAACEATLSEFQEQMLTKVLGQAWAPLQTEPAPWACPRCGSRWGFGRRGSRGRKLRTSFGVVAFRLRQVTCISCKASGVVSTFSPFPELLGLPSRARVSTELCRKALDVATRISYRQSSEVTRVMTGQSLSASMIHSEVQRRAQSVDFGIPEEAPILLLDSTKVRAGGKKAGIEFNLAMTVSAVSQVGRRRILDKTIIAMGVGRWTTLTERLKQVHPRLILVDGDEELDRLVGELYPDVPVQRCVWHLARTFGFMLWRGKSMKWEREHLRTRLRQLLHTSEPVEVAKAALRAFADTLDLPGEELAQATVRRAIDTAFTHLTLLQPLPGGHRNRQAPIATSYIERQMREIDRRVDNGSRWTESGVLNILRLQALRRLSPDRWESIWA